MTSNIIYLLNKSEYPTEWIATLNKSELNEIKDQFLCLNNTKTRSKYNAKKKELHDKYVCDDHHMMQIYAAIIYVHDYVVEMKKVLKDISIDEDIAMCDKMEKTMVDLQKQIDASNYKILGLELFLQLKTC